MTSTARSFFGTVGMSLHHMLVAEAEALEHHTVEERNEDGDTPLLEYTKEYLQQVKIIKMLTTDPNFVCDFDPADDFIELVGILIRKKANLNAQDRHFKTALILLAREPDSLKVIRYLVNAGASTLYISGGGYSCIEEAHSCRNKEIFNFLQEAHRLECQRYDERANSLAPRKKGWTTFWRFF